MSINSFRKRHCEESEERPARNNNYFKQSYSKHNESKFKSFQENSSDEDMNMMEEDIGGELEAFKIKLWFFNLFIQSNRSVSDTGMLAILNLTS